MVFCWALTAFIDRPTLLLQICPGPANYSGIEIECVGRGLETDVCLSHRKEQEEKSRRRRATVWGRRSREFGRSTWAPHPVLLINTVHGRWPTLLGPSIEPMPGTTADRSTSSIRALVGRSIVCAGAARAQGGEGLAIVIKSTI